MKNYLKGKIGQKIGLLRNGYPKEVFFEGILKDVQGEVAILTDEKGMEIAIPVDKILVIGPPEKEEETAPLGFRSSK